MIDKETIEIVAFVALVGVLFIAYQWWDEQNPF
jgi:hypothetical protein